MLRDLTYLKTRFETNDFPTQQDFYDVFDSFEHLTASRKNYIIDKATVDYNPNSPTTGAGLPTSGVYGNPTAFVFWKDHLAGYLFDGGWSLVQVAATSGDMTKAVYDPDNNGVIDKAAQVNGVDGAGNSTYYGKNSSGTVGFHSLPSGGSGDMTKAVYDTNNNGVVDKATEVDGVSGSGNSTYYGKNEAGVIGFHALVSAASSGSGGSVFAFSFSGRVYCESDNRWQSVGGGSGFDADNVNLSSGTGATPTLSPSQSGRLIPAGTKITGLSIGGRANSNEITDFEIYVALIKPNAGWAAGAANAGALTEVFSFSDFYTSGAGTPVTGNLTNISAKWLSFSYETLEDLMLQVYIKPIGNITARRYWGFDAGLLVETPSAAAYKKPTFATYIDPNALATNDQLGSLATFGVSRDFAILPTISAHPHTGHLYQVFRVSSKHLSTGNNQVIFRKSTDGAATWTGLDGTGTHTVLPNPYTGGNVPDASGMAFTPTGRLILFTREFTSSGGYVENHSMYIDDIDSNAGWSAPVVLAAGAQIGYMYDHKFVYGENGELIFGQRTINDGTGTTRYIRYYQSTDNGETWTQRSVALDNTSKGWNFGEVITEDMGDGKFVAMVRLAALNDDSLNLPFLMVSHDYGLTWNHEDATNKETLTFDDVSAYKSNSGFLPLEGTGVTLGGVTANESCLPLLGVLNRRNEKILIVPYFQRIGAAANELRLTAFRWDGWLAQNKKALRSDIHDTIFTGTNGGFNAPDGNGSLLIHGERAIWCLNENTSSGSQGPSDIVTGRITRTTLINVVNAIDTGTPVT